MKGGSEAYPVMEYCEYFYVESRLDEHERRRFFWHSLLVMKNDWDEVGDLFAPG